MTGDFVFLNENHYTKDNEYRSYSSFADPNGKVLSFNSSAYSGELPKPFDICHVDFDMQVYAKGQALILNNLSVIGRMTEEKGGK